MTLSSRFAVGCAALILAAAGLRAEQIPIINPSFEQTSRPLLVGEQTNGSGGVGVPVATRFPFSGGGVSWADPVEVPGWRTRIRPPGDMAINYAGILNPPPRGDGPFVTGQDGQNVVAVQVSQIGQSLAALIQPNTRYRLTFLGGIGRLDSDYHLACSLIVVDNLELLPIEGQAGVTRLAITQGLNPPEESFGTMLPYSLEYTSPAVLPPNLAGRFLGIQMYGSDGFPRVLYDNFQLEATPVPEPTTLGGLIASVMSALRWRR